MSSAILKITHIYHEIMKKNKYQLANMNSQMDKQIIRLQFLGESLLKMILVDYIDINDIHNFDRKNIQIRKQLILKKIEKDKQIQRNDFLQILGLYFREQGSKIDKFKELGQQIQLINEEQLDLAEKQINFNEESMISQIYDDRYPQIDQNIQVFNALLDFDSMSTTKQEQSNQLKFNNISGIQGVKREPTMHQMVVLSYLTKLTAHQTELSYLCQQFGWNIRFYQEKDVTKSYDWFVCSCQVDLQYKKVKQSINKKHQARSKRKGRMLSSFITLKYIYLKYPSVWDQYQHIKKQKSLHLPLDDNVGFQLSKYSIHQEISPQPIEKAEFVGKQKEFQHQKQQYLNQIVSFKSQLNLIIQHNQTCFVLEKPTKVQNDKSMSWIVKMKLIILIKNSPEKLIQQLQQSKNSKEAEQMNARKIVKKVYSMFPDVFNKMSMVKNKKGIKI